MGGKEFKDDVIKQLEDITGNPEVDWENCLFEAMTAVLDEYYNWLMIFDDDWLIKNKSKNKWLGKILKNLQKYFGHKKKLNVEFLISCCLKNMNEEDLERFLDSCEKAIADR